MENKILKIAFSGGGTGGHLFPIIAVARKIKEEKPNAQLFFIGPETSGSEILDKEGIVKKNILAGKLRRYLSSANFIDLFFKLPISLIQCLWILFWLMPDVLFCKGGFGGLPAALVAWIYRIPIIVHESDAVPGLANRIVGKIAKKVAVAFPEAKDYFARKQVALLGNPVRENIAGGSFEQAKSIFGLVGDKPLVFITGGSQGAEPINTILMSVLPKLLQEVEIIHQCGKANVQSIKEQLPQTIPADSLLNGYYHYFGFLNPEQMKQAYAAATIVVSRAGAATISEIATLGKPSILIPHPMPESAGDHQMKNAFSYAKKGGTIVLQQENMTQNILVDKILNLIKDQQLLSQMSKAALNFSYPDADQNLAKETLSLIK